MNSIKQGYLFMTPYQLAALINAFSSWTMLGVILIIHFIHYPMFFVVKPSDWVEFHAKHTQVLGAIAGSLMLLELASGIALTLLESAPPILGLANLTIIFSLWLVTFFKSIPAHNQLAITHDARVIQHLIRYNSYRTALWVIKAFLAFKFL